MVLGALHDRREWLSRSCTPPLLQFCGLVEYLIELDQLLPVERCDFFELVAQPLDLDLGL